jgi:hypothetical protein
MVVLSSVLSTGSSHTGFPSDLVRRSPVTDSLVKKVLVNGFEQGFA